jgi:O-antigen/teichoic acid export membrane protein
MRILGVISTLPLAILVAFGKEFFELWVPTQDAKVLQILSVITIGTLVVSGAINSLYSIFTVTNKLKLNSLILVCAGLLNIGIVFILLKTTNLGIYAVAGVSTVSGLIRNLCYTAPFGAKYLGLSWKTFYPEVFKSVLAFIIISIIGLFCNLCVKIDGWGMFIVATSFTVLIGFVINILLFFSKSERQELFRQLKSHFVKG